MGKKVIPSIFLLVPVPLIYFLLHWQLSSTGGWLMMGVFFIIPLLSFLSQFRPALKKGTNSFLLSYMALLAILLVGEVLFLPYQAYELWFELLEQGIAQGRVSHLFVKFGAFFTAMVCWTMLRQGNLKSSLPKALYMAFFFLFIIWPNRLSAIIFLVSFFLSRIEKKNVVGMAIFLFLALGVGFTGINTPKKGVKLIDESYNNPINYIATRWPALPILYDVPLYGQSFQSTMETGGKPALSVKNILTIEGQPDEKIYLRTRTFRKKGDYPVSRLLPNLSQVELPPLSQISTRKIQVNTDYINMVPYSETSNNIVYNDVAYRVPRKDETIIPDPPLFMNETYTLVEHTEKGVDLTPADQLDAFRELTFDPSHELIELAATLKGNTAEHTALKIRNYLFENYTYSLDTNEDDDYTENFLFNTKEGYCLHFASAFVALARLNDIPCRYVEGYLVIFPTEEEYVDLYDDVPSIVDTTITGMAAHVWPEIYMGIKRGWVRFEVTAPFITVEEEGTTASNRITERQLDQIRGVAALKKRTRSIWENPWIWAICVILALIGIYIPIKKLIELIHLYRKKTSRVIRKYISLGKKAGVGSPESRGWLHWKRELTYVVPDSQDLLDETMPLILRDRYSHEGIDRKEQIQLHESLNKIRHLYRGQRKK